MDSEQIRVVVAEDHDILRQSLVSIIERTDDIKVIGKARDGFEVMALARTLKPDVLVLNIEMPLLNVPKVMRKFKQNADSVKVLGISAYDEREYILGMLGTGLVGFLTKESVPELLVEAIREVAAGKLGWVSEQVAKQISAK